MIENHRPALGERGPSSGLEDLRREGSRLVSELERVRQQIAKWESPIPAQQESSGREQSPKEAITTFATAIGMNSQEAIQEFETAVAGGRSMPSAVLGLFVLARNKNGGRAFNLSHEPAYHALLNTVLGPAYTLLMAQGGEPYDPAKFADFSGAVYGTKATVHTLIMPGFSGPEGITKGIISTSKDF